MNAGWAWQIEHEHHVNRGYVYSSAFIPDEDADKEFRGANPKVQQTRMIQFRSGRYRRFWVGNVAAIGNASGFVEPLEATAIQMICQQSEFLSHALHESDCQPTPSLQASTNRLVAGLWDEIRDFLAVHYRFNSRLDTPFWRHCQNDVALHGAEPIVEFYRENGPSVVTEVELLTPGRSMFHLEGFYALLLGQKVPHSRLGTMSPQEKQTLEQHRAACVVTARTGLTVAESLTILRHPGWRCTPGFYAG